MPESLVCICNLSLGVSFYDPLLIVGLICKILINPGLTFPSSLTEECRTKCAMMRTDLQFLFFPSSSKTAD